MEAYDLPPLISVKEAAKIARLSQPSIIKMCHQEKFRCIQIGRVWRINSDDFLEYLQLPNANNQPQETAQAIVAKPELLEPVQQGDFNGAQPIINGQNQAYALIAIPPQVLTQALQHLGSFDQ